MEIKTEVPNCSSILARDETQLARPPFFGTRISQYMPMEAATLNTEYAHTKPKSRHLLSKLRLKPARNALESDTLQKLQLPSMSPLTSDPPFCAM